MVNLNTEPIQEGVLTPVHNCVGCVDYQRVVVAMKVLPGEAESACLSKLTSCWVI